LTRFRPWIAASLLSVCVALAGGEVAARWLGSEQGYVSGALVSGAMHGQGSEALFRPHARFVWIGHPGRKHGHWNETGHAWAAEALEPEVERLLPKRPGEPR
jgi:hypothetical protein